ncbi:hypothetical protein I4U23_022682 [Adineta vaga]|nr:hypothetical protein I4U23_022682 [Adineta vaga]
MCKECCCCCCCCCKGCEEKCGCGTSCNKVDTNVVIQPRTVHQQPSVIRIDDNYQYKPPPVATPTTRQTPVVVRRTETHTVVRTQQNRPVARPTRVPSPQRRTPQRQPEPVVVVQPKPTIEYCEPPPSQPTVEYYEPPPSEPVYEPPPPEPVYEPPPPEPVYEPPPPEPYYEPPPPEPVYEPPPPEPVYEPPPPEPVYEPPPPEPVYEPPPPEPYYEPPPPEPVYEPPPPEPVVEPSEPQSYLGTDEW